MLINSFGTLLMYNMLSRFYDGTVVATLPFDACVRAAPGLLGAAGGWAGGRVSRLRRRGQTSLETSGGDWGLN